MHAPTSTEDSRGVDIAQIRALLRLTPAERVQRMVDMVNTMKSILVTGRQRP